MKSSETNNKNVDFFLFSNAGQKPGRARGGEKNGSEGKGDDEKKKKRF